MHLGFGSSKPGRNDKEGHPIITVVDRSGIHGIGVSWCCCSGAPKRDMQLMMAGCQEAALTRRTSWGHSRGGVGLGLSGKQLHAASSELTAWQERPAESLQ